MGGGPVIKYNASQKYVSDAYSAAVFAGICKEAAVPYQTFVNNSEVAGRANPEDANGEDAIVAHLVFKDILCFSRCEPNPMQFDVVITTADVVEKSAKTAEIVRHLKEVFYRNQQLMKSLKVGIPTCGFPDDGRPRIHFPLGKKRVIYAYLNWDTIAEDSKAMCDFVKELATIIETAKTKEGVLINIKEGIWL